MQASSWAGLEASYTEPEVVAGTSEAVPSSSEVGVGLGSRNP